MSFENEGDLAAINSALSYLFIAQPFLWHVAQLNAFRFQE